MPEGESKPKSNKSKDWLAYADKKEKQFRDHHSKTNMFGRLKNPQPLGDDYSRLLSNNALEARTKGMKLKREEAGRGNLEGMSKGGAVRATGKRRLHRGEMVRSKCRGGSR